jgi:hypothetical protein
MGRVDEQKEWLVRYGPKSCDRRGDRTGVQVHLSASSHTGNREGSA